MNTETVAGSTADPTIQFTPLTLGKTTYKLVYDFNAVAMAEELTGLALLVGVNWARITVPRLRAMLYACALKAQPDVTLHEFTPHIRHANIGKIQTALFEAWTQSVPEPEDASANPPEPSPETAG